MDSIAIGKRSGRHAWFRTPLDWCSAAYHPARSVSPDGGVRASAILCPSLGIEHAGGRRGFRHLAAQLSDTGVSALRIDLPNQADSVGCGDGREIETHQLVDRWISAITTAIELLKELEPSAPVVLIGRRVGALLAAKVAHSNTGVARLIMWDACTSGSLFLREMRMLSAAGTNDSGDSGQNPPVIPGAVEAVGYRFSAELTAAIDSLSLSSIKSRRDLHVTSVHSTDTGRLSKVLDSWVNDGVLVSRHVVDDVRFDPDGWRTTALPVNTFENVVSSLTDLPVVGRSSLSESAPKGDATNRPVSLVEQIRFEWPYAGGRPVTERVVRLGGESDDRLVGRTTELATDPGQRLGIVMLRALGGSGANVVLSRQWAARGATVLRVDLSGSDESEPRPGEPENAPYPRYGAEDIGEIVTWFRRRLHRDATIAVIGECADAYYAVHAAANGVAIDDVIAVNPQLYWNGTFDADFSEIAHVTVPNVEIKKVGRLKRLRRILNSRDWPKRLLRASRNRYARLRRTLRGATATTHHESPEFTKLIRLDIPALFPPSVRWHVVFSQGDPGLQHLYAHGRAAMDRLLAQPGFRLTVAPTSEHLFLTQADRQWLDDFMTSCLPFATASKAD